MIDRLFSLALLLCVLAGGTTAVGVELFRPAPPKVVAELPRVVVTGRITAAADQAKATQVATTAPSDSGVQAR